MRLSKSLLTTLSLAALLPITAGTVFAATAGDAGVTTADASASTSGSASRSTPAASASTVSASTVSASTASPKKAKAKFKKAKGDDFDGDRSLNMFQVEPTVINERYYTSGQAEHHQKISPTLPFGAPIPDNEGPYAPAAAPAVKPQTTSNNDKLDSQVVDRLASLESIKNDSPALKLKLRVSTIDGDLVSHLKALKVDVISSVPASGDMVIYAPARNVSDIGNLKEVLGVVLAQ